MNTDVRVQVGYFRHHKTEKLIRKLGVEASYALIQLWTYTGENKSDGILINMDEDDIAIAAGYKGDSAVFLAALVKVGFVDEIGVGKYAIHDWIDHNPWAAGAATRSEKARAAANARWGNTGQNTEDTKPQRTGSNPPANATGKNEQSANVQTAMPIDASSMPVASFSNAPNHNQTLTKPYPYPNPTNPLPGVQGGDTASESDSGDGEQGGQAGGFSPIGEGEGSLSLPDSSEAEKLSPEELYSRFQASGLWQTWGEHLHSVVIRAKTAPRNKALYLRPVIVRILRGEEPLPGEIQTGVQDRKTERENAAKNRVVVPEQPKQSIPCDWLPGVEESQLRGLANQAFHRVRLVMGNGIQPICEAVRDEVRAIWRQLHPNEKMPWVNETETQQDQPAVDVPDVEIIAATTPEQSEIRGEIVESLAPMGKDLSMDYSAQNNSDAKVGAGA